jgi:hypothetical protein
VNETLVYQQSGVNFKNIYSQPLVVWFVLFKIVDILPHRDELYDLEVFILPRKCHAVWEEFERWAAKTSVTHTRLIQESVVNKLGTTFLQANLSICGSTVLCWTLAPF